jgi:glycosyltransferase involved in cell wall biosynthesis
MLKKLDNPFFSIIIPCYNQAHFLEDSIESVRRQSFSDWELIIINDGSTDNTKETAEGFAKLDNRINVINQPNKGLSEARNAGLSEASGKVVNFLDSDDWLLPYCLQMVHETFRRNNIDLLVSSYTYFKNNEPIHSHVFGKTLVSHGELMLRNIAPPVAFFISSKLLNAIGSFDTQLKSCEDWDFWIRAGKMGAKIYTIPEVLVGYRYVANSMSRNPRVMYDSMTEVSRRAGHPDPRLPKDAPFNQFYELDYPTIQKKNLIQMLGVMLHQGKIDEAVIWYVEEQDKWNWKHSKNDWKGLSSYLSWGYFLKLDEINNLLSETYPLVKKFLVELGYSESESANLVRIIFAPQLKKRNHFSFGRGLGAFLNKMGWY